MAAVLDLQDSFDPANRQRLAEYGNSLTAPWAVLVLELAGRIGDGEERFARLADSYPDPYARVVVSAFSALVGFCSGDVVRAGRWAGRGLADDRGRGFSVLGATCQVASGWAGALTGDPGAGLAVLEQGLVRFRATGALTALGLIAAMRADARLAAGEPPSRVRIDLESDAAEVVASGEQPCLPYLDLARARLTEAEGGDSRPHLRRAAETAALMKLPLVERLASLGRGTAWSGAMSDPYR
jgi:hypothetical protein